MSDHFSGMVAIVTGGSRGIGLAISQALAREGASVVIASVDEARGKAAQAAIAGQGGRAEFIATDVTQRDQVARLVQATLEQLGGVHILVNNAAVHEKAPFCEESEALWDRMYRANVIGTVLPSQLVVPHMQEQGGGAIVHIASKAGVVGEPGHAAYSASKGAVIALTRAMAIELASYAIRVNAVCPGPVMTDMLLEAVPTEAGRRTLAQTTPLGRVGRPEDVASAVLYLASSGADWCTGQAISIDGGLSILM